MELHKRSIYELKKESAERAGDSAPSRHHLFFHNEQPKNVEKRRVGIFKQNIC